MRWLLALFLIAALGADAGTVRITVVLPAPSATQPAHGTLKSADAIVPATGAPYAGTISGQSITFDHLRPGAAYDIQLNFTDGTVERGIDMSWYNDDDATPNAGPLTDSDIQSIKEILHVPSFYNKSDILQVQGDHDRAVALVRLVRDKDFVNGAGQVIWRIELWYFKNQHGGWEKVLQQNKVIRRERFKTAAEYHAATDKLHYSAELGGLYVDPPDHERTVTLSKY
ncbi:MAG TPA: hypothetical protein VHY37_07655 [Tepidisphaeraceae bacterium]|jgi:hypothetical protein|nr:hypothetical protein [Tepidisphaeraceae bacterium]